MFVSKNLVFSKYPEVSKMTQEEFDNWKINLSEESEDTLDLALARILFKKKIKDIKQLSNVLNEVSLAKKAKFNKEKLFYKGIGKSFFYVNEFNAYDWFEKFDTLYECDKDEFEFQEKACAENNDAYQMEEYKIYMKGYWCRFVENDNLVYGSLYSAGYYIFWKLEDVVEEKIDELFPHKYVEGEDNGKKAKDGFSVWDWELDANGKEDHLMELRKRVYKYLSDALKKFNKEFANLKENGVLIIKEQDEDGVSGNYDFIFSDADVLKNIHLNNFYDDCLKYENKKLEKSLNELYEEYLKDSLNYLNEQYEDVLKNFIPPVKKKEKRKIFINNDIDI